MRGGKKIAAALATLLAAFPFVHAARAQLATPPAAPAPPVTLTWNAPAGCSDSETILKEVAHLRGDDVRADKLDATATVSLDPSGVWNLQITTILPNGTHAERQIQAESCKAAADATASILALALTQAAASETSTETATKTEAIPTATATSTSTSAPTVAPRPSASISTVTHPSPSRTKPKSRSSSRSSDLTPHLYFGASLGGTSGDLPSLGFGALGEIGVAYGALRVETYGGYWALGVARFSKPGGARFQLLDAGARTCLSFGDTFQVGPCAAFELGSLRGESFDVTRPSSGSALNAEALLGGLGTLSLDKSGLFRVRALLEIGADVDRPEFVLDGVGFVHQPAPIVGRGTVGAELRF